MFKTYSYFSKMSLQQQYVCRFLKPLLFENTIDIAAFIHHYI